MQSRVLEHRQLQVPCSCHTLLCVSSCRLPIANMVIWTQQLGPRPSLHMPLFANAEGDDGMGMAEGILKDCWPLSKAAQGRSPGCLEPCIQQHLSFLGHHHPKPRLQHRLWLCCRSM